GERTPGAASRAVPQREVDRGERDGLVAHTPARVEELHAGGALGLHQHGSIARQRLMHALRADAVVGLQRRGLAVAGRSIAVAEGDGEQLTLADGAVGGCERALQTQYPRGEAHVHRIGGVSGAETVVLLHGFGGTRRAWDGVAALLPRERYLPLALDLPGHGEAADAPRPI